VAVHRSALVLFLVTTVTDHFVRVALVVVREGLVFSALVTAPCWCHFPPAFWANEQPGVFWMLVANKALLLAAFAAKTFLISFLLAVLFAPTTVANRIFPIGWVSMWARFP
jgi:hypothetical protein